MVYRKYRRPLGRSRYVLPKRSKYSTEQKSFQIDANTTTPVNSLYQNTFTIVEASNIQGMRKVKHIMCNLTTPE